MSDPAAPSTPHSATSTRAEAPPPQPIATAAPEPATARTLPRRAILAPDPAATLAAVTPTPHDDVYTSQVVTTYAAGINVQTAGRVRQSEATTPAKPAKWVAAQRVAARQPQPQASAAQEPDSARPAVARRAPFHRSTPRSPAPDTTAAAVQSTAATGRSAPTPSAQTTAAAAPTHSVTPHAGAVVPALPRSLAQQARADQIAVIQAKMQTLVPLIYHKLDDGRTVAHATVRLILTREGYVDASQVVASSDPGRLGRMAYDVLHLGEPYAFVPGWFEVHLRFHD